MDGTVETKNKRQATKEKKQDRRNQGKGQRTGTRDKRQSRWIEQTELIGFVASTSYSFALPSYLFVGLLVQRFSKGTTDQRQGIRKIPCERSTLFRRFSPWNAQIFSLNWTNSQRSYLQPRTYIWWLVGTRDKENDGFRRRSPPVFIDFVVDLHNWLIRFLISISCLFAYLLARTTITRDKKKEGFRAEGPHFLASRCAKTHWCL